MKTRMKSTAKVVSENETQLTPKSELGPSSTNPPQLFILPDDVTDAARIVSLANSRYQDENRYLICPKRGIYEFSKVAAPRSTPRSWLLSSSESSPTDVDSEAGDNTNSKGYITSAADLFVTTPIDPLFFLLPALAPASKNAEPTKTMFLSSDDYLEKLRETSSHFSDYLLQGEFRKTLDKRMAAVCDTVDAGEEMMFRLNEEKLLAELFKKAKKMTLNGLPASMEDKLVRKALEVPMLSIKREDSSLHELANEDEEPVPLDSAETSDSQSSSSTVNSASTSISTASTAATSISGENSPSSSSHKPVSIQPSINAPQAIVELLRLRTAFSFICSNYMTPSQSSQLKKSLATSASPVDFKPLDEHLAHLTKLRQEALAARSVGDYSRKRAMEEDDETIEIRAEKKRKIEEEGKRKNAGVSVGLRKLQKVNTSGMKKMSDFFKKK